MAFFGMKMNILLCAAFLTLFVASPSSASDTLPSGQSLSSGGSISQGSYIFIIQRDCNLVLYDLNTAIWSSGTNGRADNCILSMQNDGNLVIYSGSRAIWASNTNRARGSFILTIQRDRNVVIYALPSRTAIWATGTNLRGTPGVVIAQNTTMGK